MAAASVPKLKARQVLRDLRIESPDLLKYLKEICVERGAFVRESELSDSEGRLVVSGNKGIITVNPSNTYLGRTRFSIAHELGHFEIHRQIREAWNCTTQNMNDWSVRANYENKELEANEFAAELLMPLKLVRSELENEKPSLSGLKDLASRYNVSLSAIACRFIELTREACAVAFIRNGQVTHAWRSRLFELQKYRVRAGKLDSGVIAARAARGLKVPGRMTEVLAGNWLEGVDQATAKKTILEQSEHFKKIDFGMSLLWIRGGDLIRH